MAGSTLSGGWTWSLGPDNEEGTLPRKRETTVLATQGLPAAGPGNLEKRQAIPNFPGVCWDECQPHCGSLAILGVQLAPFMMREVGSAQL